MSEIESDMLSPEQFAELVQVTAKTIYRNLQADQDKPESERRLPGARKEGSKFRGEWKIPRSAAEHWKTWEHTNPRKPRKSKG